MSEYDDLDDVDMSKTNEEYEKEAYLKLYEENEKLKEKLEKINHPLHYTSHPSGIECIEVTKYMDFLLGNALKYIWRADLKGNKLEDLRKAAWYLQEKIKMLETE